MLFMLMMSMLATMNMPMILLAMSTNVTMIVVETTMIVYRITCSDSVPI